VIRALLDEGPGTAAEIANREGVSIGEKQTRDWLKRLRSEGYVSRDDSQPYTWGANGQLTLRIPPTCAYLNSSSGRKYYYPYQCAVG